MPTNQYRDYVRRSFFRYAFSAMLFLFLLVAVILFVNIQWFSVGRNKRNNEKLTGLLNEQMENYKAGMDKFAADSRIQDVLCHGEAGQITEANRLLYDFSNAQTIHCAFALVDIDGNIVCSNLFERNRSIFLESNTYHSMVEKIEGEPEKIFLLPSRLDYSYNQAGDLLLGRGVVQDGQILGFLFLEMFDEQIYEYVREYTLDDLILTDCYDNLIFSIGRQSADPMNKYPTGKFRMELKEEESVELNGKRYNVQKGILPDSSLILYTLVSMEFQRSLVSYGLLFFGIAGVLLMLILRPLVLRITERNLHDIDALLTSVEEMGKGNMDYRLRAQVFDEFKQLNDAYRNMVIQREELLKHNTELAERKRVMEIKQLEEQFNPHFIFNVLETLRYEISIDAAKASEMVMAFANLMRYSIYYGNAIVPLQTDIEYINDYLLLQKMRYNRRLTYHIDIPEEYMLCKIPKLLLQPVVENSLSHGMKDRESISIIITAAVKNGNLILCVEDNGIGIRAEKLEKIRCGLEQENVYQEHIGLYNSHRVVRLLYGADYGLTIEGVYGEGTRVYITLPSDMEDEDV